ncbi:glycosyltransferase [Actinomycetes bacterium KLBMP 9759]
MKALILAFGTRGDVQPFVALARELRGRGHDPVLAAPARFAPLAAAHDITFATVDDGPLRLMNGTGGVGDTVTRGIRGKLAMAKAMPATFGAVLDDAAAIATTGPGAGAEVIVHNGQIIAAPHLGEVLGVPVVLALTVPLYLPTRAFAWPGQALPRRLPGALNRASYLGMRAPQMMFARTVDQWRRDRLDLPDRPGRHNPLHDPAGRPVPVLNAVSRHVVAPPPDWPDQVTTTGYWFLSSTETSAGSEPAAALPETIAAFLAAGPAPVQIGFGSMTGPDPAATTAMVLQAVDRAGVRAILASGWGGLTTDTSTSSQVLVVDDVPHDLLLPHVAAVVHHGGAGTTAAAAAAGRPQVIAPFVADQPFWAARMHTLGVAPPALPQRRLTATGLAAAITHATTDTELAARAAELGSRIRAEHGTAEAVTGLENLLQGSRP